jgi:hypothetical protein
MNEGDKQQNPQCNDCVNNNSQERDDEKTKARSALKE